MKNYMEEILKENNIEINERFVIIQTEEDTFGYVYIDEDYDLMSSADYIEDFDGYYWVNELAKGTCKIEKIKPALPKHNEYRLLVNGEVVKECKADDDGEGIDMLLNSTEPFPHLIEIDDVVEVEIDRLGKKEPFDNFGHSTSKIFMVNIDIPIKIK
jgi:hypothetical protein